MEKLIKYYVFMDKDNKLLGQTSDKIYAKHFTKQLKDEGVEFEKVKAIMTHKETTRLTNFIVMDLVSLEPYTNKLYPEVDIGSYMYYLANIKNDLKNSVNTLVRLLTMCEFSEIEKRVVLDYMEYLEYVNDDLEWFENEDDVDGYGDVAPEEYFDMDKIMKSMKDGTLTL